MISAVLQAITKESDMLHHMRTSFDQCNMNNCTFEYIVSWHWLGPTMKPELKTNVFRLVSES
jgi:hypothetical protein